MINFELTKVTSQSLGDNRSLITLSPLPSGYGMTIGNALRRVILSSIPGGAVTAVRIKGVTHEFSTVTGVKESAIDIILNLKLLRVKKSSSGPALLTLKANKEGKITAAQIKTPAEVEIINNDLIICTLEKGHSIEMELRVENGIGYLPSNARDRREVEADMIMIDALFSPVTKVRYEVSNARVGQMTDLDKLDIEVATDGTISPQEVVIMAARILRQYMTLFDGEAANATKASATQSKAEPKHEKKYTPIEALKISQRSENALINNGIGSVEELLTYTEKQLSNLRGFGKKGITEVVKALNKMGLHLSE
ncbi:MAG: DNA-directed RNA polymerase subunit alpha [Candidatus Abawacabacteria bacterium]|nr:DNA-directed RNA polymerase subunit alpha [Candidatus Abawacabacteria bacterium]